MRKQDVRMIVTDLDNTLFNEKQELTQRTLRIIDRCGEAGIPFVPVTGRQYGGCDWMRSNRGIPYFIFGNGAVGMRNETDEELFFNGISRKAALRTLELFASVPCTRYVFTDRLLYTDSEDGAYHRVSGGVTGLEELIRDDRERIVKVDATFNDVRLRDRVWQELEAYEDVSVSAAWPFNIEVNGRGGDKGSGVLSLAKLLRVPPETILSFGDGRNDVSMLRATGWSAAMENGMPEAKAAAKLIAPPNSADGEAAVIEALVFGEENEWTPAL